MGNFNENKKYHFIYKTTNLLNNKFYVGMHSTNDLIDGYLGSGKRLRRSLVKYGIENFKCEILEYHNDRKSLAKREREIVNLELINEELCLNLMIGGEGGRGFISDEQQRYRSHCGGVANSKRLKDDDIFRKKHSERVSKIMKQNHKDGKIKYDTFTGKKHTDDSKNKMRLFASKQIGEKNHQFGTIWVTNGVENKKIKKTDIENYLKLNWKSGRSSIGDIGKNQYNK